MTSLTLAVAQIRCHAGDIAANMRLHLEVIAAARSIGADVLLFPELSLTDYMSQPDTARLARGLTAPEVHAIAGAAGPMCVSFGMIEAAPEGVYNTQLMVDGSGLRHVHRKLNLPQYGNLCEADHYAPGQTLTLADHDRRIATLICADSWNPALVWLTAMMAPDVLLQPIASARSAVGAGFDNPAGWDLHLRHTAMIWGLPVAMCNHVGTRGALDFWGGSRILDAFGREIARAGDGEALIHARIDLRDVSRARGILPTARDADPALVARLLRASGLVDQIETEMSDTARVEQARM